MLYVINNKELKIEVKDVLNRLNIDVDLYNTDNILQYLKNDKKRNNQVIDFVILENVEDYKFIPYTLEDANELLRKE